MESLKFTFLHLVHEFTSTKRTKIYHKKIQMYTKVLKKWTGDQRIRFTFIVCIWLCYVFLFAEKWSWESCWLKIDTSSCIFQRPLGKCRVSSGKLWETAYTGAFIYRRSQYYRSTLLHKSLFSATFFEHKK